jgi:hypothetical protein
MVLLWVELSLRLASATVSHSVMAKAQEIARMHSPSSKAMRRFLLRKLTVI